MAYELIITEKPQSAKKIAEALADGKPVRKEDNGIPYFMISHGNRDIIVASAVGHLYGLEESQDVPESGGKKISASRKKLDESALVKSAVKKKSWTYPVFAVQWAPIVEKGKKSSSATKFINVIRKLAKDADVITVATDYDIEGEVIGLNVVRFACNRKDARRMKYSTLTKEELTESYEHASPRLDWGQANAGETRHILDYYYGINLSRALMLAIRSIGGFKVLSAGRVQGPALKILVEREREIKAFKSEPFWQIELHGNAQRSKVIALHEEDKFWDKKKADAVMKNVKGQRAFVDSLERKQFSQPAPVPFDLTSLQLEAYRSLRISPKDTLAIAQTLYLAGLISYPRTSSQKLPSSIGYRKILSTISLQEFYRGYAQQLLALPDDKLRPNEGKKTDPAHPAIYPTGIISHISGREARVYDLIMRRFLATFGEPAVRETMTITIDVNREKFIARGTRTVKRGWHEYYGPHVKLEEEELPSVSKGEEIGVEKIALLDKVTQPPKHYTPASIIKELEKRGLGTKSTRAAIVDALFRRGYASESTVGATELGIRTFEVLEKHCPEILDEELTRKFEDEMDSIREDKKKPQEVLDEAKDVLTLLLTKFKKEEKQIGKELSEAMVSTRDALSFLGKCPVCDKGDLQMRSGRFGPFVACSNYPDCKTTLSLPQGAKIVSVDKTCPACKYPMIKIFKAKKRPFQLCLNPKCSTKRIDENLAKKYEKPCPKCGEGRLILRKSLYGAFLGCSRYPRCRTIERLTGVEGLGVPVEGTEGEEGESAGSAAEGDKSIDPSEGRYSETDSE